MLLLTATQLVIFATAVLAEVEVRNKHPERHPGNSSTALARYLCGYLKRVVAAGDIFLPRGEIVYMYKAFAKMPQMNTNTYSRIYTVLDAVLAGI